MRHVFALPCACALFVVWLASACSSSDSQDDHPASGGSGGTGGAAAGGGGQAGNAGAGADGQAGAGSDAYGVTIEASSTRLCPGECTLLLARAHDGRPPYTYSWSH